jgi:hypothetical protein
MRIVLTFEVPPEVLSYRVQTCGEPLDMFLNSFHIALRGGKYSRDWKLHSSNGSELIGKADYHSECLNIRQSKVDSPARNM